MKKRYFLWSLLLGLLFLQLGWAQQKTITGTVNDENGLPLPGVTVIIEGTTQGVATDFEGNFTINAQAGEILIISYVGYADQQITIDNQDNYTITMVPSSLEEVIVIGYGTSTKEQFVGTATKIETEEVENKNTTNISQALAGEVAGVTVINTSGQPGSSSTIRIRGFGSISGNRNPLYVVDGIPFSGNINSINKADVESYTVLKDASATAIYGSRGANGVVLITTKKGKSGTSKIEVTLNQGTNRRALPQYNTISSPEQYVELSWESLKNFAIATKVENPAEYASNNLFGGRNGISSHYNMWDAEGNELIDPNTGKFNTGITRKYTPEDWSDNLFRNGQRTEVNLRLSGGVDKTTYSTSFGALKDYGYLLNSSYERYNTRVDVGHEIKSWLKGNFNVGYTYINSSQTGQESDATSAFWFVNAIPPIYPVYLRDENGDSVADDIFEGNQYDFGNNGRGFGLGSNPVGTTI
ncbi:MAG: SusC/RagA family TonB-linked outer membrane protein, partial [Flavobacteriaceae bacterium]